MARRPRRVRVRVRRSDGRRAGQLWLEKALSVVASKTTDILTLSAGAIGIASGALGIKSWLLLPIIVIVGRVVKEVIQETMSSLVKFKIGEIEFEIDHDNLKEGDAEKIKRALSK